MANQTLPEFLQLASEATPQPWFVDSIRDAAETTYLICDVLRTPWGNNVLRFDDDKANADFVAAAVNKAPVMAKELKELLEHAERVEAGGHSHGQAGILVHLIREAAKKAESA